MDEIKAAFASNLIRLRTEKGMTQAELGEILHYTDKAVSKWERAESVPDAFVLMELSRLFGIRVDDLLTSHDKWQPPPTLRTEKETYSRYFILLSSIVAVWTLCMVEFVVVWTVMGTIQWIVFVAAVPLSLVVLLVFNSIWFRGRGNMFIVMALVLSLVLLIYLMLLKYHIWQVFLILLPAELLVFLVFQIRRSALKTRHSTGGRVEKTRRRAGETEGSLPRE